MKIVATTEKSGHLSSRTENHPKIENRSIDNKIILVYIGKSISRIQVQKSSQLSCRTAIIYWLFEMLQIHDI